MLLALGAGRALRAQQPPPPPQTRPTFETRIDLMQLDVSVLDAKRQPIKGLTAADFTILEDGTPRNVETLVEIDVPPARNAAATSAAWQDAVPQDVFSSETVQTAKRVVVVVIDDNSLQRSQQDDARILQKTRDVARAAIGDLGEGDLAALVYASNNFSAQSLTTDRRRLLDSIGKATLSPGSENADETAAVDNTGAQSGECWCNLCSVEILDAVSRALGAIPNLRKTVLFVSAGILPPAPDPPPSAPDCHGDYVRALQRTYHDAALANVNVHAFDPTGLRAVSGGAGRMRGVSGDYRTTVGIDPRSEFLRTVAENTGGVAVVNNNDPDLRVPDVLAASRSYYLLGFQPTSLAPDGKMRKLRVQVNRKDVTVEARSGYVVPLPDARAATPAAANTTEVLPRTAFPLEASAGAFVERNGQIGVGVTLGVTAPGRTLAAGPLNIVARIVDAFGGARGTLRQTLTFPRLDDPALRRYDVLAKLPLAPGRYDIRLSVETAGGQASGVHVPVEVPDFFKDALSASSLVLSAVPSAEAVPKGALDDLLPVVPTTRREFDAADSVTAFLQVYQQDRRRSPVATIDVLDAAGDVVVTETRALTSDAYGALYAANCLFDVPIRRLQPGPYLLSVTVTSGKDQVQRAVKFQVK
jgi:VWFA-related protein